MASHAGNERWHGHRPVFLSRYGHRSSRADEGQWHTETIGKRLCERTGTGSALGRHGFPRPNPTPTLKPIDGDDISKTQW